MKYVVAYQLDNGTIPKWIFDGGYLPHKIGDEEWLVGITADVAELDVKAVALTESTLLTRLGTLSDAQHEEIDKAMAYLGFSVAADAKANDVSDALAELDAAKLPATAKLVKRLAALAGI